MATSMAPLNVVSALAKAIDFMKAQGWTPTSGLQKFFLDNFYDERKNFHLFGPQELRAWADTVAENLNRILKAEGFSLRFDPFGPDEFGVLSILDISVEWLKKGLPMLLPSRGQEYPTVHMENRAHVDGRSVALFDGFETNEHPHPIVGVHSKSGDKVFMTVAAGGPERSFALMAAIDTLRAVPKRRQHFDYLRFPMVDFKETKSLPWLVGMKTNGARNNKHVAEAQQETMFKMNHTGAHLKDAVTLTMRGISMPRPLIIDQPFYLWIERPGLGKPIFYAYFDQSVWKDPGSLTI